MYYFMHSIPKFAGLTRLNSGGITRDHMAFRFWISCPFPKIFAIKFGSCVKSVQILHVLAPNILGESPEFLDLHYKIDADVDHVANFCADRPTELLIPMADLTKQEIWGRSQHKAARRSMSDLNYILGVVRCVKFEGPAHPRGRIMVSRKKFSWVGQHEGL